MQGFFIKNTHISIDLNIEIIEIEVMKVEFYRLEL